MGTQKPRLLFYFLHLLGVGHVYRARRLIEAFAAEGLAVDVVYGGVPLEGVSFAAESVHYLPPVRAADATYKKMLTGCLLYTSPSPRDQRGSRMPSSA